MSETEARPLLPQKQEQAAALIAEGRLANTRIASKLKVTVQTLWNWRQDPVFQAAVAEYKESFRTQVLAEGIARLEVRVAAQNERHQELEEVIASRSREHAKVPGGKTGMLVRQVKFVKVFELRKAAQEKLNAGTLSEEELTQDDFIATKQTQAVEEYSVDTGLLNELRQLEKHTAQELGQWIERSESHVDVAALTEQELEAITKA